MTDLPASGGALWLHFAYRIAGEVVVQEELLIGQLLGVVEHCLVELGTQGEGGQRLRLAAGKNRRAVRGREVVHFAPDGADILQAAPVEAYMFREDHIADHLLFEGIEDIRQESSLCGHIFLPFLGEDGFLDHLFDGVELRFADLLVETAARYCIDLVFG